MTEKKQQKMNYKSFHYYIRENYKKGSTVLELGSGEGTKLLTSKFKVYSVENDPKYIGLTESNYIYTPLKSLLTCKGIEVGKWYDPIVLKDHLPKEYDVFIVDAPIGSIGRMGLINYVGLFNKNVEWIIDDVNRPTEFKLLEKLSLILGREYKIFNQEENKKFAVI